MHPIEHLRHVARATGAGPLVLVPEAAAGLASLSGDEAGLVLACKRLVDRHPTTGALWWLCARVLAGADPCVEARRCALEVEADATARILGLELPEDATLTVVGWPELVAGALSVRGDLRALVVDAAGEGRLLARELRRQGVDASAVPESGTGAAAAGSDVVVLEAHVLGPGGLVAAAGSRAAAAVAHHAGVPVWAAVGVGRALPVLLWDALVGRLARDEAWAADVEVVPLDLVEVVVGPTGTMTAAEAASRVDCPAVAELLT